MPDSAAQRLPLPNRQHTVHGGLVARRAPSPILPGWSRESCPELSPVPSLGNRRTAEFAWEKGLWWFGSC